ncbi:hypothetical protein HPB47_022569 [Ixodes persulcatus]|uniref:Uncharacterized protein n=1 Tax=Ixodes persulcatus TaxID=34615 RepID=A0AC60R2S2_IXOPE|nr:hypothetical protein HPB47_022569 [Ixodes persulcatus]
MSGEVAHNYTLIFGDIALLQLLDTLRFYGAGTFQTVTGDLVHVFHPTVCHIVRMVMTLIVSVLFRRLVHFPAASECHNIMLYLYRMGQFPAVLRSCHSGVGMIPESFHIFATPEWNGNGMAATLKINVIHLRAITGPQLQFFDVVASWPGYVHDSCIFDGSRSRALYEESRVPGLLLGDMGYALSLSS